MQDSPPASDPLKHPIAGTWSGLLVLFFFAQSAAAFEPFEGFSRSQTQPVNIGLEAVSDPDPVRSGEPFKLFLLVTLSEGWHIYSLAMPEEDKELSTEIHLAETPFRSRGAWMEPSPQVAMDGALEKMVRIHIRSVEFSRTYQVPESVKPGAYPLEGTLVYSACNNKICTLPRELPFKTTVRVVESDGSNPSHPLP